MYILHGHLPFCKVRDAVVKVLNSLIGDREVINNKLIFPPLHLSQNPIPAAVL